MKRLKTRTLIGAAAAGVLIAAPAATAAGAPAWSSEPSIAVTAATDGDQAKPLHVELAFHHPVSLQSALTVREGAGLPILGYRFESDSIAGNYWEGTGLSATTFLDDVERETGTAPEVVAAYVDATDYAEQPQRSRAHADAALGADLPLFDAPDAIIPQDESSRPSTSSSEAGKAGSALRAANDTWQPNDAQVEIRSMPQNLSITSKYSWWSYDPFAAPYVLAFNWGMEFQLDFYTTDRIPDNYRTGPDTGFRPFCGSINDGSAANYKDWAAASNRPFSWYGWVIDGMDVVVPPSIVGLYGDYNDLSDPCTVSSVTVGAAWPQGIPSTAGSTQELMITMYPAKGLDSQSVVGSIVQPVSRQHCINNPSMSYTDCMGVTPGGYPGPGPAQSRMVLNNANGWHAPELCWYSGEFGTVPALWWNCYSGS